MVAPGGVGGVWEGWRWSLAGGVGGRMLMLTASGRRGLVAACRLVGDEGGADEYERDAERGW